MYKRFWMVWVFRDLRKIDCPELLINLLNCTFYSIHAAHQFECISCAFMSPLDTPQLTCPALVN